MTSPNLLRMAKRAELPIRVAHDDLPHRMGCYWIWPAQDPGNIETLTLCHSPAEATRAYFALVESLDPGTASSLPGTAADCSASSAPERCV